MWWHPTYGDVSWEQMVTYLRQRVQTTPGYYNLMIGTDSQGHAGHTRYVTALVLHNVGHGATFFIHQEREQSYLPLQGKIWHESLLTYKHLLRLEPELKDVLEDEHVHLQVHLDCGTHGPTRELIKEVTGLFSSMGWDVVIKPDSVAASCAADRYSK